MRYIKEYNSFDKENLINQETNGKLKIIHEKLIKTSSKCVLVLSGSIVSFSKSLMFKLPLLKNSYPSSYAYLK